MVDDVPLSQYLNNITSSKVCRLCGSKDGPFLNIFGPGMDLAKKIEETLLIVIKESDELPHKICFRCSAKVADFHEFLEKCVNTQEMFCKNLRKDFTFKKDRTKHLKSSWEAKLNKNKLSNDEYCDELVMKALQSVATLPSFKKSPHLKKQLTADISTAELYRKHGIVKNVKIKLWRADHPNYPGVERKNNKFFVTSVKRKPKPLSVLKRELSNEIATSMKKSSIKLDTKKQTNPINKDTVAEKPKSPSEMPLKDLISWDTTRQLSLIQESLKNLESQIKKQPIVDRSLAKVAPEQPADKDQPIEIPPNFSPVKVADIGTLFTCNFCHHSILDKNKMFTHKCYIPRPQQTIGSKPPNQPVSDPKETSNTFNFSRPHRSIRVKGKPIVETSSEQRLRSVANNTHAKTKLQTYKVERVSTAPLPTQLGGKPSTAMSPSNDSPATVYPKFYFMPMEDNSYSLQLAPPSSDVPVKIDNHAPPKTRLSSAAAVSSENSILPDCNKTLRSAPVQPPAKKLIKLQSKPPSSPTVNEDKKSQPPNKKSRSSSSETSIAASKPSSAPYPVGLLCRSSNNKSSQLPLDNRSDTVSKSESNGFPQYTILPSKSSGDGNSVGKIVISTISSAKNISSIQKPPLEIPKKRGRKVKQIEEQPTQEDKNLDEIADSSANQHFFTYVNLDPMYNRPYGNPESSVLQEPKISTSALPPSSSAEKSEHKKSTPSAEKSDGYTCTICELRFSREKKLISHVKTHFETDSD